MRSIGLQTGANIKQDSLRTDWEIDAPQDVYGD
jgi:hypothetical protein